MKLLAHSQSWLVILAAVCAFGRCGGAAGARPRNRLSGTSRGSTSRTATATDLAKLVGYTEPVKKVIALEYKVLLFQDGKETPVDPKTYQFKVGRSDPR